MWLIILLIVVGVFLLVAELVLLPGLTVAGIGALISYVAAVWLTFNGYGATGAMIAIGVIIVLSIAAAAFSLRAKTWKKLSLNHSIESTSQPLPQQTVEIGAEGVTVTRLAPLGKIEVAGESYEARSLGDLYIDPRQKVEVVGFENFTVIVKVKQ